MSEPIVYSLKTVAWFMVAKKLIKFTDSGTAYKVDVKNDFVKSPIIKGEKVGVDINNGIVTWLEKCIDAPKQEVTKPVETPVKAEPTPTPKVEPEVKKETPTPKVDGETSTVLTIFAVAANKKVVKFTELKDAGWFQIDEKIQAQDYSTIGLIARNKVRVKIVENKVVEFTKIASEPAESPKTTTSSPVNAKTEQTTAPAVQTPVQAPKKDWKPTTQYNDDRQTSIECQAMINSASDVVGRVAASISPAPTATIINNMIRAIAESNYNLLQELKKR